jgi:oligosaccharide repeat unit polymerase
MLKGKSWIPLFTLYIPIGFLAFAISGSRGYIIFSIVTSLLIVANLSKVGLKVFLPIVPFIFFGFALLGVLRRSSETSKGSSISENVSENTSKSTNWYLELASYQLQMRDEMVFDKLDNFNMLYGLSYLNLLTFWIPRDWLGGAKPKFTDAYVDEEFWGRTDIGLPLNSMIESYFNFSYFGVFIFFVLGFVMAGIYNQIDWNQNIYQKCFFVIYLVNGQTYTTSTLVFLLQSLVIVLPIYLFLKND